MYFFKTNVNSYDRALKKVIKYDIININSKGGINMNKYKIIALLLILALSVCSLAACGNSATPGEKNDKLISETPDDLDIVDDELKKGAEEVTAITGATDINGKVTDSTGIIDKAGHRIY